MSISSPLWSEDKVEDDVLLSPHEAWWYEWSTQYRALYEFRLTEKALSLAVETLRLAERSWGERHPFVAQTLNDLGYMCQREGNLERAALLHQHALEIRRQMPSGKLGEKEAAIAQSLNNLAQVYQLQGRLAAAEAMFGEALRLWESYAGPTHPYVAATLFHLAQLYHHEHRFVEAESSLRRIVMILEQTPSVGYIDEIKVLDIYADVLRALGKFQEAQAVEAKATRMRSPNPVPVPTAP